jgi:hypothetical protein
MWTKCNVSNRNVSNLICMSWKKSMRLQYVASPLKFSSLYQLSKKKTNTTVCMPEWGNFYMTLDWKNIVSFCCNVSNHDLKNRCIKSMQGRYLIFWPNIYLMVIYWSDKLQDSGINRYKVMGRQSLNNRSKCNVSNHGIALMRISELVIHRSIRITEQIAILSSGLALSSLSTLLSMLTGYAV